MSSLITKYGVMAQFGEYPTYILTIDASLIDSALTSFPLTVSLTDSNFDFSSTTDSDNIYFTDQSDNILDFEVEYFDLVSKKAVYHVKVPSISSSVNTIIKLRTDGDGYINGLNPTSVWSEYSAVYHMGETIIDSTGNNIPITQFGSPTVVDSILGKGRSFDGVDDAYMMSNVTNILGTGSLNSAISLFCKAETNTASDVLLGTHYVSGQRYYMGNTSSGQIGLGIGSTSWTSPSTGYTPSLGAYHHYTFRSYNGAHSVYIDTQQAGSSKVDTSISMGSYFGIGALTNTGSAVPNVYFSEMEMAELRFSSTYKPNAWCKAEYHSLIGNLLSITVE